MDFNFFKKINICSLLICLFFSALSYSQKKNLKKEPFDVMNDSLKNYENYVYYRNRGEKLKINKRNLNHYCRRF